MKFTIEQQGVKWVASNGTEHVEADDPAEALYALLGEIELTGEQSAEVGAEYWEDVAQRAMVRLIRLLATRAPEVLLRRHATLIVDAVVRHTGLRT